MICVNKKQALEAISIKSKVEYDENLLRSLFYFLRDLGEKNFPEGSEGKKVHTISTHNVISINNSNFPPEIDFDIVYPAFISAVISGKVERYGYSNVELARCFNSWIAQDGVLYRIKEKYYERYPKKRPIRKKGSGRMVEDFTDEEITNQIKIIKAIDPNMMNLPLFRHNGADSYFARLKNEAIRRNLTEMK